MVIAPILFQSHEVLDREIPCHHTFLLFVLNFSQMQLKQNGQINGRTFARKICE